MKRYLYIILGIVALAVIAIVILFIIKARTASPTVAISGTPTTGSLPVAQTQGVNGSGSGTTSGSAVTTLGLTPTNASGSATSSAPTNGQLVVQNFGVLSDSPVLDYFVDPQNRIVAIEPTGVVISIASGQSTTMNTSTINSIISAKFSYNGGMALVSYGDPAHPSTELFNLATNAWTPLQQTMISPQWSPTNNDLIAYLTPAGTGKLAIQTINGASLKTAPSTLTTLNVNDVTLQWPTQSEFIISDKPSLQSAGSILAFNPTADTLTPLFYEVLGVEGIWSNNPAIPYGLVFFNNSPAPGTTLQLQAISGNLPTEPLTLSTLPTKCAFNTELMPIATSTASTTITTTSSATSSATSTPKKATSTSTKSSAPTSTPYLALYCGVPRSSSGFSSAQLPDDYNMMALFTSDDIYKVNTQTGAEQVLWSDPTQNIDVSDVKFANNALFFVNRYDQKLYGLTFSN